MKERKITCLYTFFNHSRQKQIYMELVCWIKYIKTLKSRRKKLISVATKCLLLSHIQETVEKKLSVNNLISIEVKAYVCQPIFTIF